MTVCVVEQQRDLTIVKKSKDTDHPAESLKELIALLAGEDEAARKKHRLTPLLSHNWFSAENTQHVEKWCRDALAAIGPEGNIYKTHIDFLISAMVDRYYHDRALFASSLLPHKPPLLRPDHHSGEVIRFTYDMPLETVDLVSELIARSTPCNFILLGSRNGPSIYAHYVSWMIKVAEWER